MRHCAMAHNRRRSDADEPSREVDFYDYVRHQPRAHTGRRREPTSPLAVSDDWLTKIPVTELELDIIETHFGELLDELFGRPA
ncbi:hypothetical protein SAMN05519104_6865 [Rhizobiales bacterium GAS188]|nr:hypothetical protein SAMN05519104_6865 [Rhizobiales bacterium GAS188]